MSDERWTERPWRARWRLWQAPDIVWVPLAGGSLILIAGVFGLAVGEPLLFPSLGPTAFLQAEPEHPASRFYNTTVGHLVGLGAGLLAVWLLGAAHLPFVLAGGHLTSTRVWAAALAMALALLVNLLLHSEHAPAGATTLIVALGGFDPTLHDALVVTGGVLLVGVVGESLRRLRLRSEHRKEASRRS